MDLRRVMAGRGEAEGASLRGRSASGLGSVGSLKPPVYPHIRFPYCGSSEPLRPFFVKSSFKHCCGQRNFDYIVHTAYYSPRLELSPQTRRRAVGGRQIEAIEIKPNLGLNFGSGERSIGFDRYLGHH